MARFTIPRDVYYGPNAMEELKALKGHKKAIVVTGTNFMIENGSLEKLTGILKENGMQVQVFDKVESNPRISTVYRGAEVMRNYEPDVIVALGGGSPVDAAKAMWVFYENPELKFDDIKTPFSLPKMRRKAIFAAVGTTSGTGTEVTSFSVITDDDTKIKYPIADFEITPDIAIVDTEIPLSMSKTLTADSGMDALTHAVEAYVATAHTDLTDCLAIKAAQLVFENLVDSYNESSAARRKLHVGQDLAGMAFSNALLGIVHSLAHKVGVTYDVTHGRCNAIMLPYVIEYNSTVSEDRFADIARALGLDGATNKQLTNSLVEAVKNLNGKLGIPLSYKEAGVNEKTFLDTVDVLAEAACGDPCTLFNPRETKFDNMKKVLTCCYYGTDVNF
ncbi:iron-containing alcohol dehydrogenase [Caproiciproducens sp. CPB-2]|uniref:iron-containing alcohol dehydrogenase n=1 Tax=Caproiciproducens sp. CPB-2 TaxID=3030017 RepID=UPI0023D9D2C0|nr:iron-containing alcohol dehydrogenase [Caproiciproducens sp. CPB-2]MDF1493174.1 iron-containing alcohol dehydrogenase [Caproiciproducens sp. CPB-2]